MHVKISLYYYLYWNTHLFCSPCFVLLSALLPCQPGSSGLPNKKRYGDNYPHNNNSPREKQVVKAKSGSFQVGISVSLKVASKILDCQLVKNAHLLQLVHEVVVDTKELRVLFKVYDNYTGLICASYNIGIATIPPFEI